MNWLNVETWLKTTVPGIVVLGAVGSVIAVWLCKLFGRPLVWLLRLPFEHYITTRSLQAYTLGFSHASIENDKSGRLLITFCAYHLARLLVFLFVGLAGWIVFLRFAYSAGLPVLTATGYAGVVLVFLSVYGVYFELEIIYRTFVWLWGESLEHAKRKFDEHKANNFKDWKKDADDTEETENT